MIKELAQSPYLETSQTRKSMKMTIDYLDRKIKQKHPIKILDIGQPNPLSKLMKYYFLECDVYNTDGDLDEGFSFVGSLDYDFIVYSHTIEHQFNPLYTLLRFYNVINSHPTIFIILPQRPKFLWFEGHYHEIDHYRMQLLLKRAGLKIVSYESKRIKRDWWFYFTGIRPLLRFFFERVGYYEVKKF